MILWIVSQKALSQFIQYYNSFIAAMPLFSGKKSPESLEFLNIRIYNRTDGTMKTYDTTSCQFTIPIGGLSMNLPKDPVILLSYINTQLRDHYPSLAELAAAYCADEQDICNQLAQINYHYDPKVNQFL